MNKIRVLIVDDELLARRRIVQILADESDFEIIGESANGLEAMSAIEKLSPDLIFLDIKMPVLDGFGLVEKLSTDNFPEIIFVTAFDEHAIRAFEVGAIDYILKPINLNRFSQTLTRIRQRIFSGENKKNVNKITDLIKSLQSPEKEYLERIPIKKEEKIKFVEIQKINYIKTLENYLEIFTEREKFLLRETMDGIAGKLNPKEFVRIRRSILVRVSAIKELNVLFNGEFSIILQNGTELISSRRFRKNLDVLLKI